jgi:gliding motility-associated-like protein
MKKYSNYLLQTLFIFVLFFCYKNTALATHIIGGEMNYKCLGNNKYEISLTIYRDCYYGNPNAWFDNPAYVGVFDKQGTLVDSLKMRLRNNDTLAVVLNDTCLQIPQNVCVHTTTYKDTITLLPKAGGYYLAYQRCCRNQTIVNIVDPLQSGATFGVEISEEALMACNSNAKFKNWPPIFICVNEPIKFDHSAIDIDNDSIYYKLCTPLLGGTPVVPLPIPTNPPPYDTVVWKNPYSLYNILGGTNPLKINPQTGELSGIPITVGQFVVGICAFEYRKGKLISVNRRDFQYNIGVCTTITAAFFAPKIQCNNLVVKMENKSKNASKFLWTFGDPTKPTFTSNDKSPTYTYPDTGTYVIRLIANPNSACADTFSTSVILKKTDLIADFDFKIGSCADSVSVELTDKSKDPSNVATTWEYVLTLDSTMLKLNGKNQKFKLGKTGKWTVKQTVTAKNGCPISISKEVNVNTLQLFLKDTIKVCAGDSVQLNPGGIPNYRYKWTPKDGLKDTQTANPIVQPTKDILYTVMASLADSSCQATRSTFIKVTTGSTPLTLVADKDTIYTGGSVQLTATKDTSYMYIWTPISSLSKPNIYNPIAKPTETTVYTVKVKKIGGGCGNAAQVTVYLLDAECREPFLFIPNAFTPNDDGVNDFFQARGNNIDSVYLAVYDRWGQRVFETQNPNDKWDGNYGGVILPPDVYAYYVVIRCRNGQRFFKKGNVSLLR